MIANYSMNEGQLTAITRVCEELAGNFLVVAIRLDLDMAEPGQFTVAIYFPRAKRSLLAALKSQPHDLLRADLTDFSYRQS